MTEQAHAIFPLLGEGGQAAVSADDAMLDDLSKRLTDEGSGEGGQGESAQDEAGKQSGEGGHDDEGDGGGQEEDLKAQGEQDQEGADKDQIPDGDGGDVEVDASILAAALGLNEDQVLAGEDGGIKFRLKVDGQEVEVTPTDFVKGYQLEKTSNQRVEALSNERKAFEQQRQQSFAQMREAMQNLQATEQALVASVQQDYQAIDWQRLREENPAEYAAAQEDMRQRQTQVGQLIQQSRQQQQVLNSQAQQQQLAYFQQLAQQQEQQLKEARTDLQDPSKWQEFRTELRKYLMDFGYSEQQVSGTIDHKDILIADKARQWDEYQAELAALGKKKVKRKVKVLRAGPAKNAQAASKAKNTRSAMQKAVNTQTEDAWVNAIGQRMGLL